MSVVKENDRNGDVGEAVASPSRDYESEIAALKSDRNRWKSEAQQLAEQFQNMPTIDRTYLMTKGTMRQRQTYHMLAREVKAAEIQRRRELGQKYLADARLAERVLGGPSYLRKRRQQDADE